MASERRPRGYSLVTAVVVVTLLTLVGTMVLDQVIADTKLSGSERAAQNALYVADAGNVWGQQQLISLLFAGGSPSSTPLVGALMVLPPLPAGDPMCPDLTAAQCMNWFLLTPGPLPGWVNYGGTSSYRVAVTCNPQPCSVLVLPVSYSIRSMSTSNGGAMRLVEQVLGPS